jgi:Fic family protein
VRWNWEFSDWPHFRYDPEQLAQQEGEFLLAVGGAMAYLKTVDEADYNQFRLEVLSWEGAESSRIEGEILDRESLQSSLMRHFGLHPVRKKEGEKEARMAKLLCRVYETFDQPLTHEMLWEWHAILFEESSKIESWGQYRTHAEPMQIVSHRYGAPRVHFEAPPSAKVHAEMTAFIAWYNTPCRPGSILARAALAHIHFESIHPFEDGNGRLGRLLSEKALSQGVGRPILIAISKWLEKRKKEYYAELEKCNRTLDVTDWTLFFASIILESQAETMRLLAFLIAKAKMMKALEGKLNERQTKALLRLFAEGPDGFKGGLSADKYIAITKATRASATRDLADLVEKRALYKVGSLRHTRYHLHF